MSHRTPSSAGGAVFITRRPLFERLSTVRGIHKKNPLISEAYAKTNGLDKAIVRIGDSKRPKVLIDEDEFDRWLENQRETSVA